MADDIIEIAGAGNSIEFHCLDKDNEIRIIIFDTDGDGQDIYVNEKNTRKIVNWLNAQLKLIEVKKK